MLQEEDAIQLYVEAGHCLHAVAEDTLEKEPGLQAMQEVEAATLLKKPTGHCTHVDEALAAVEME